MSKRRMIWATLVGLVIAGCSAKPHESTGNTNWVTCTSDSECGELACLCGHCSATCDGTLDCSLPPDEMCRSEGEPADAASLPPLPALQALWGREDTESSGLALAVATDGSLWVAGGADRTYFDLSFMFPSYWLAHFDASNGTPLWEDRDATLGTVGSLALSGDGRVATVTTNYVDGNRTTLIERDTTTGAVIARSDVLEEAGAAAYDPANQLFLAGSHLTGDVGGRPTAEMWIAAVNASHAVAWEIVPESPQQGWTGVRSLAHASDGTLVVGGFQGTTTASNASVPWVMGIRDGFIAWEHVYDTGTATTGAAELAVAHGNGVLVRGMDAHGAWLRALSSAGETEWTERIEGGAPRGALVALPDGGYALSGGGSSCYPCTGEDQVAPPTVTGYSADREPVWRIQVDGCEAIHAAATTPSGELIVVAQCDWGLGLYAYDLSL